MVTVDGIFNLVVGEAAEKIAIAEKECKYGKLLQTAKKVVS